MDRDYDGRLSFGEFMGEETPLEKVLIVDMMVDITNIMIFMRTPVIGLK